MLMPGNRVDFARLLMPDGIISCVLTNIWHAVHTCKNVVLIFDAMTCDPEVLFQDLCRHVIRG